MNTPRPPRQAAVSRAAILAVSVSSAVRSAAPTIRSHRPGVGGSMHSVGSGHFENPVSRQQQQWE
ncbi:hypothetical protein [Streptomyces sennicomposti]